MLNKLKTPQYAIADQFKKLFHIQFANNRSLREEAFKIRHSVYSQELGWEPENRSKLESDECDDYAYHCLLKHRRTGQYAGCIRLVIPPASDPTLKLPFEKGCLASARTEVIDSTKLVRGSFGEISRLAVLDTFRKSKAEIQENSGDAPIKLAYTNDERRFFPQIATGLYLASIVLADLCKHSGVFAMMEPKLNRRMQRLGLPCTQVGETMNYHGSRAMYFLHKDDFNSHLSADFLELYNDIHDELSEQLNLVPYADYRKYR